jgi:DNA polymerase III subunit epsilon
MLLFFDTETTGLPRNWKAPVTDVNNWPRLVQLAFLLYDREGNRISEKCFIIKPEGFKIPADAARIHGITTEIAASEGKELNSVLKEFSDSADNSNYLVAHNISFDEKIVGAELLRNQMTNFIPAKKRICTMQSTTDFCKIQGPYGYKWPSLQELHFKLFGETFVEAHDALVDINATAKCFWELRKRGKIVLP